MDGTAKITEADTGVCKHVFGLQGGDVKQFQAAFSSDGTHILITSKMSYESPGVAQLFDVATGQRLQVFGGLTGNKDGKFRGRILSAQFSHNGERILTLGPKGGYDLKVITVYDTKTGAEIAVADVAVSMDFAAWSRDGSMVIAASPQGSAELIDAQSGSHAGSIDGHTDDLLFDAVASEHPKIAVNADGKKVLLACCDATARILEASQAGAETGSLKLSRVLRGHLDTVVSAAWSPDDTYVLTASLDGCAKLPGK